MYFWPDILFAMILLFIMKKIYTYQYHSVKFLPKICTCVATDWFLIWHDIVKGSIRHIKCLAAKLIDQWNPSMRSPLPHSLLEYNIKGGLSTYSKSNWNWHFIFLYGYLESPSIYFSICPFSSLKNLLAWVLRWILLTPYISRMHTFLWL